MPAGFQLFFNRKTKKWTNLHFFRDIQVLNQAMCQYKLRIFQALIKDNYLS